MAAYLQAGLRRDFVSAPLAFHGVQVHLIGSAADTVPPLLFEDAPLAPRVCFTFVLVFMQVMFMCLWFAQTGHLSSGAVLCAHAGARVPKRIHGAAAVRALRARERTSRSLSYHSRHCAPMC